MTWIPTQHDSEQTFGPMLVPGKQVPALSYRAIYPDFLELAQRVTSPAFFFAFVVVSAPEFGWVPEVPDAVAAAGAGSPEAFFFAFPTGAAAPQTGVFASRPLDWLPTTPVGWRR